jgi:hypothetical protein
LAADLTGTVNFRTFARMLGNTPSYVHALKQAGRLVLTDDGKRVKVAESQQRIRDTEDPGKVGVAARHAAARQAKAGEGAAAVAIAAPAAIDAGEDGEADPPGREGYQYWRERNERAKALASERENLVAEGKLMDAAQVEAAVAAAATTLRSRLESLPDVLGPQLAAINDEPQARATIAEAIEHALEECSRQFANIGRQVTP